MSQNQSKHIPDVYNIERWGDGYFRVDEQGYLCVSPKAAQGGASARLADVLETCRNAGLRAPVLARFSGILRNRVRMLAGAFRDAIVSQGYTGGYSPVYPIKVNQQRRVVHEILRVRDEGELIGLEAGSKPELLAVLALSRPGDAIVCNGYKDREYIRLALMGEKLGFRVHVVIEKLSELDMLLEESRHIDVKPHIGLRIRLLSESKGNWQDSGGEKSKFGLSAAQLMRAVAVCRDAGHLDAVRMLHFHLGSQIANIQDIKGSMREVGRYYQELRALGAPIETMDVGGGLGVDYEGTRSRSACSTNYSVVDYAWHIVQSLKETCDRADLPHPDIFSESGRALTAHHAVLLVNIIDREQVQHDPVAFPDDTSVPELALLQELYEILCQKRNNLTEIYHEVMGAWQDLHQRFLLGELDLPHRALAEKIYINALLVIRGGLDPTRRQQRELLDQLNEKLADKLFVNFSVFQSVPDVWGIDQVFPILPLGGLNRPSTRRAILQDITCDSDGRIDQYVDGEGVETTLPLPDADGDELGIFMVGAYQEILGDLHNLFGDTDSVDVEIDEQGSIHLHSAIQGDTVSTVLRYVNYDPNRLLDTLNEHCQRAALAPDDYSLFMQDIREGLAGYTYLE